MDIELRHKVFLASVIVVGISWAAFFVALRYFFRIDSSSASGKDAVKKLAAGLQSSLVASAPAGTPAGVPVGTPAGAPAGAPADSAKYIPYEVSYSAREETRVKSENQEREGGQRPRYVTARAPIVRDVPKDASCSGSSPEPDFVYRISNRQLPNFEQDVMYLIYNPDFRDYHLRMSKDYSTGFNQFIYRSEQITLGPLYDLCIERRQLYEPVVVAPTNPQSQSKRWKISNGIISDPLETVCLAVKQITHGSNTFLVPCIVPVAEMSPSSCNWIFVPSSSFD